MGLTQKVYYDGGKRGMDQDNMRYTVADIEALPEGKRAELFDGKMYMMASPTATHQLVLNYINYQFYKHIRENRGECQVFIAPFAVYLNETDNYVEPDLVVICDKTRYDEKGCHGAPDLVVEIVSPSSKRIDYAIKLFKYRTYGTREYWIVDPEKKRIQVYDFDQDDMNEYSFSDKVPVGIYEGQLVIDFTQID